MLKSGSNATPNSNNNKLDFHKIEDGMIGKEGSFSIQSTPSSGNSLSLTDDGIEVRLPSISPDSKLESSKHNTTDIDTDISLEKNSGLDLLSSIASLEHVTGQNARINRSIGPRRSSDEPAKNFNEFMGSVKGTYI